MQLNQKTSKLSQRFNLSQLKGKLFDEGYLVPVLIAVIYAVIWSYITLAKFYSFGDYVWDLGLNLDRSWVIFHPSINGFTVPYLLSFSGISYLVSPFIVLGGYPFMMVFQSAFLAFTVIPLFYVSKHFLNSRIAGWIISASFLLYFPLAGVNWNDFHYQAMFVPLFISAYALYLRGNIKASFLLFFLSGITRFPYVIFPLLFALWITFEQLWNIKREKNELDIHYLKYPLFAAILVAQLAISFLILGSGAGLSGDLHASTGGSLVQNLFTQFDTKIQTIMLFLFPVLGLPLLSRKWSLFLLPGIVLILIATDSAYIFPRTFTLQYGSGLIPFIFLGMIEGIHNVTKQGHENSHDLRLNKQEQNKVLKIAITVLVVIVLMGTVYLPYGPLNDKTTVDFHLNEYLKPNLTMDREMENLISLIPGNASNVLVQNNLPQLVPRPTFQGQFLIPGINIANNMTYRALNGDWMPLDPAYIIEYPFGNYFMYLANPPLNISMYQIITQLYAKYDYGIVGEASDMMLLEKGYNGPLKYYVPYNGEYPAVKYNIPSVSHLTNGNLVTDNNLSNVMAWWGPYTALVPGTYDITYSMASSAPYQNNSLSLSVAANVGSLILAQKTVPGSALQQAGKITNITMRVEVDQLYSSVEFRGWINAWKGHLIFDGVHVKQIAPIPVTANQSLIVGLIPNNASVLTQRAYVPGINSSKIITPSDTVKAVSCDYILTDVNQGQFWQNGALQPMYEIVNNALSSGKYGLRAESGNLILLEKGFTGQTLFLTPNTRYYPGTSFFPVSPGYAANGSIYFKNGTAVSIISGPYTTLMPGTYNVTFELFTTNNSLRNNITLTITSNSGATTLATYPANGSSFNSPGLSDNITLMLRVTEVERLVEFKLVDVNWNGLLIFKGAYVKQIPQES